MMYLMGVCALVYLHNIAHMPLLNTTVNLFALALNYFDLYLTWSSVPSHTALIQINLCTVAYEVTTPTRVYRP